MSCATGWIPSEKESSIVQTITERKQKTMPGARGRFAPTSRGAVFLKAFQAEKFKPNLKSPFITDKNSNHRVVTSTKIYKLLILINKMIKIKFYENWKKKRNYRSNVKILAEHGIIEEIEKQITAFSFPKKDAQKILKTAYEQGIQRRLSLIEHYSNLALLKVNETNNSLSSLIKKLEGNPSLDWRMEHEETIAFYLEQACKYGEAIKSPISKEKMKEIWGKAYIALEQKAKSYMDYCDQKEKEARKNRDQESTDHYVKIKREYYFPIWERYSEKRKQIEKPPINTKSDTVKIPRAVINAALKSPSSNQK